MTKLLFQGCTGKKVRRIQDALNKRMLFPVNRLTDPPMEALDVDGIFGPKTEAMVKEFQRLNRIKDDGIVGPLTRYHLFPYIAHEAVIHGRGEFAGYGPGPYAPPSYSPLSFGLRNQLGLQPVSDPAPKDDEKKPEGFRFELFVERGMEVRITRAWPPRFGKTEQTVTVGAVLLRPSQKLEISGELEGSKPLRPQRGDGFEWGGQIKASYEAISPIGPVSPLSPFVQIAPLAPLPGTIGIEAKLAILKNVLELSVEGQTSFGYDWDQGKVKAGVFLATGLTFNLDILFRSHPPSKP